MPRPFRVLPSPSTRNEKLRRDVYKQFTWDLLELQSADSARETLYDKGHFPGA